MFRSTRRVVAIVFFSLLGTTALAADEQVLYVSPSGSNSASGASSRDALGDLQAAVDKGLSGAKPKQKIVVRVLPGTYTGQTLKVTADPSSYGHIEISGGENKRPIFDGDGSATPWLNVVAATTAAGQITVSGIEVTSYSTAINLSGSRDNPGNMVAEVVIRNNVFRNIGQQSEKLKNPSTAAIRLVNADRVQIVNNRFSDIRNRQRCGLLHAVYVAHGSTDNLIKGNTFEKSCGDAVRFRDASGGNRVEGNTFVDAWADAAISDWYCEASSRDDCSKKYTECPSFGNAVVGNKVVVKRAKKSPEQIKAHGADAAPGCEAPSERSRQQRFSPS